MGGSTPSSPAPPPPPVAPPPPVDTTAPDKNEEAKKAKMDDAQRAKLAKGMSSTIMTSPVGDTKEAEVKKASLYGEGGSV